MSHREPARLNVAPPSSEAPTGQSARDQLLMTTEPPTVWSRGALILLLGALLVAGLVPVLATDAPQDDAYITYRYARNFANGDGFVFNAGEEPVEGYTNFLWTLIIGLGMRAGFDPERFAPGLGLAATVGVALLTALLARALGARSWLAALAALVYAVRPGLTVHAMSGLETPLFALLLLGGLLPRMRSERRPRDDLVSGLCLALTALTRPEGMLLFGLLELADAFAALRTRQGIAPWLGSAVRRAIPFVLIVGAHLAWRLSKYGDWVPNTFHAKVAGGSVVWAHGFGYSFDAIRSLGLILFALPYLLAGAVEGRRARLTCLWISTVYLVYVGYVGGDYIPGFRFLLPIMPLWCALSASSLDLAGRRLGITTILGANGAGKTTTLRSMCGMVKTNGTITFDGENIAGKATESIVRRGVAHVPEGRGTFVRVTTEENLALGAYTRSAKARAQDMERVYTYFPRLKERRNQQAGTLSGGEQQMLAVGRALMLHPRLMLLDEPSFGLAPLIVQELFEILRTINKDEGVSMLLVEQNANLALDLADHAYLLETGRVVMSGTSAEIRADESVRSSYLGY